MTTGEKPVVVLRSRDDNSRNATTSPGPLPESGSLHQTNAVPAAHSAYPVQQPRHNTTSQSLVSDPNKSKLGPIPEMKQGLKIIDENFRWVDTGIDWLLDQNDFLVVGVLGTQGVGKSTILSFLAGNSAQDAYRNYVFQPENREMREDALHQTMGVEMFASPERIIFLDSQALLSASVLDLVIQQEKKFPVEYSSAENYVEMQSLQLASFLMTVCHVVIVAQDWFADLTLLRSILTAEMLKPQTHAASTTQDTPQEENQEYYPTVMFLLNKAREEDFSPQNFKDMKMTIGTIFQSSKLHYKG